MRARPPARNGSVAAALLAGMCALATGKVAEAQATCQGSFATSSPSAPALVKYIPAATRSGVVFHTWLDTNHTPAAGHLVVENTNPYPVAVRFDADLWGAAGTVAGGSRCVWLRPREYAVAVQEYPTGTLSAVRVRDAEVGRIEPPPVRLTGLVPPRAPRPRTRVAEPDPFRPTDAPSSLDESSPRALLEDEPSTRARQREAAAATREISTARSGRARDTAASTPRRERIPSTQVARRDTAARSTTPRREASAPTARRETPVPTARRETAARAPAARRDTAARSKAPRRETPAPTARRNSATRATAAHREPPATRHETGPTWTTLGDTPIASGSRAVQPSRATRRDTAARVPASRLAAVAPKPTSHRVAAAPDTSSRAANASDPLAHTPDAADSAGEAAMTERVADEPADSMLSGAAVIAPRPAPSRSPEGETAESYPSAESGIAPGTGGRADAARSVKLREDAPTLAKTGTTLFSVAFAALMVPAGIVLLMAIGGVAWLLATSALRRAWPGRRRD